MATFSNQATLTYNGNTVNSNIAFGEILDVLTVSKTAVDTEYSTDGVVSYVITVRNTGNNTVNDIVITDDLGGFAFNTATLYPLTADTASIRLFVDGVLQPAPTVTAGPPLTISGVSIPAGGDAVIIYQARVNQFADPNAGGTITNTATLTGGGLTAPISDSAVLNVTTEPELTITKAISPAQVVDNDRVTYTFVIQNNSNTATQTTDAVTITDTFNPILTALAVTLNDVAFTAYTYDESTGLFTTTAGAITVPAATTTQDPTTGVFTTSPGTATLTVTGTI